MPISPDWLQRLNLTTDYAELQDIFAQIAADAESSPHDLQLAETIDQAIQRLIQERTRDQRELNEVQTQYEAFKESNRGVVGWFKRHLPFTETRRQESEHRDEVANQSAEILGDNLVIARAQIIKERLLPIDRRRLGQRAADWQVQWDRSHLKPQASASLLVQLNAELESSQAFVDELKRDIEAFGAAEFRDVVGRQRRDADLATARRELDTLKLEIQTETALKQSGLRQIVTHIANELNATDMEFRHDGHQIEKLRLALNRLEESQANVAKLVATVSQVSGLAKQLQAWPEQLQQARQALAKIEAERAAAAQAGAAKTAVIQERQGRLVDAQRTAEQAAQMLASLQGAYDAYLAQCASQMSMPQMVEMEPSASPLPPAPIVRQFQMAKAAVDHSQSQVRDATASLETARREASQAEAAVKAAADKIANEQRKLNEFEKKEPQIRSELAGHADRGHREFAIAAAALAAYLATDRDDTKLPPVRLEEVAAGTYGWLGPLGLERACALALLQSGNDFARHLQATTMLDRLVKWQDGQRKALEQERAQANSRRESLWKRRCRELLDESLATEACAGGLPG